MVLRPSRRTVTSPTSRSTCRCFDTDGCPISRASTMSLTERSSPARNSRIWRRRGSAMALKGSEVVGARGTPSVIHSYMGICQVRSPRQAYTRFSSAFCGKPRASRDARLAHTDKSHCPAVLLERQRRHQLCAAFETNASLLAHDRSERVFGFRPQKHAGCIFRKREQPPLVDGDQHGRSGVALVLALIGLQKLRIHGRPRCQHLSGNFLTESDPEAVQVADDDLAHAIERIVRVFNDLDAILDSTVERIDLLCVRVEIDFAAMLGAELSPGAEHHFTSAEGHDREAQAVVTVAVGFLDLEPDVFVPIDRSPHVGHVEHWNDLLLHGLPRRCHPSLSSR